MLPDGFDTYLKQRIHSYSENKRQMALRKPDTQKLDETSVGSVYFSLFNKLANYDYIKDFC